MIGLSIAWRAASAGWPSPWWTRARAGGQLGRGRHAGPGRRGPLRRGRPHPAQYGGRPGLAASSPATSRRPRAAPSTTWPAGRLLVAADASDRVAVDDVLRYRLALGLAARRLGSAQCRAPSPCWPRASGAGWSWPTTTRSTTAWWSGPARRLSGGRGLLRGRRGGRGHHDGCRVTGVTLTGRTPRRRCRGAGGRLPLGPGGRGARLPAAPGAAGQGSHPPAACPRRCPPAGRGPCGAWSTAGAATWCRGRTGRWWSGPPSRRRGSTSPCRRAGGRPARRCPPAGPVVEEYELGETTTGLRPGSPDNAPHRRGHRVPGLVVATGHYRNGILLAPVTADEVVRLLGLTSAAASPTRRARGCSPPSARTGSCRRPTRATGPRCPDRWVGHEPRRGQRGALGRPRGRHRGRAGAAGAPPPRASPWPATARWCRRAPGTAPWSPPATGSRSSPPPPAGNAPRATGRAAPDPPGGGGTVGRWSTSPPTSGTPDLSASGLTPSPGDPMTP